MTLYPPFLNAVPSVTTHKRSLLQTNLVNATSGQVPAGYATVYDSHCNFSSTRVVARRQHLRSQQWTVQKDGTSNALQPIFRA
jgi:hypothetical protein